MELIEVLAGSCTFITGGTLVDAKDSGATINGTAIQGGTAQKLAKGIASWCRRAWPTGTVTCRERRLVSARIRMARQLSEHHARLHELVNHPLLAGLVEIDRQLVAFDKA